MLALALKWQNIVSRYGKNIEYFTTGIVWLTGTVNILKWFIKNRHKFITKGGTILKLIFLTFTKKILLLLC